MKCVELRQKKRPNISYYFPIFFTFKVNKFTGSAFIKQIFSVFCDFRQIGCIYFIETSYSTLQTFKFATFNSQPKFRSLVIISFFGLDKVPYLSVPLHTVIKLTINGYDWNVDYIKFNVDCVDTYRSQPEVILYILYINIRLF